MNTVVATMPEEVFLPEDPSCSIQTTALEEADPRWSVLDDIERSRLEQTTPEGAPNVYGNGFCYVGREAPLLVNLGFVGHRYIATTEDPNELAFDAGGIVWATGFQPRAVRVAGQGLQVSSLGHFTGVGRVSYQQAYNFPLPQRFVVSGVVVPTHRRARQQPVSRPYRACKDLGSWLGVSDEDVASMVGVGRTTLYSWKRGAEPRRPAIARQLYQLHAVLRALYSQLGEDALRDWLKHGSPCPQKLLEQRDFDPFERLADEVLFPRNDKPVRRLDAARLPNEPKASPSPADRARPLKRSGPVRNRRLGR